MIFTALRHYWFGPVSLSLVIAYRSAPPAPPGRLEWKKKLVRLNERPPPNSLEPLLRSGPRFTGVDQGSDVLARVETHKSWPPCVPARSEVRISSKPSRRGVGNRSLALLLSSGTKTAGPKVPSLPMTLA